MAKTNTIFQIFKNVAAKISILALILSAIFMILLLIVNRLAYKLICLNNYEHETFRNTLISNENISAKDIESKLTLTLNDEKKLHMEDLKNRYTVYKHEDSLGKNNKDKKVLIVFNGINSNFKDSIENRVMSLFNSKNNKFDEVIFIKYPRYSFSMEGIFIYNKKKENDCSSKTCIKKFLNSIVKFIRKVLYKCFNYDGVIGHCETTMKKLLDQGYSPESMDFFTYSMGGGVGARTIKRFESNDYFKNGEKFHSVINYNSFSKNYKVHGNLFKKPKEAKSFFEKIVNFLKVALKKVVLAFIYVISLGYHIESTEVYISDKTPVENKYVVRVNNDEIINDGATLAQDLTKKLNHAHNGLKSKGTHNKDKNKLEEETNKNTNLKIFTINNPNLDKNAPADFKGAPNHCHINVNFCMELFNAKSSDDISVESEKYKVQGIHQIYP